MAAASDEDIFKCAIKYVSAFLPDAEAIFQRNEVKEMYSGVMESLQAEKHFDPVSKEELEKSMLEMDAKIARIKSGNDEDVEKAKKLSEEFAKAKLEDKNYFDAYWQLYNKVPDSKFFYLIVRQIEMINIDNLDGLKDELKEQFRTCLFYPFLSDNMKEEFERMLSDEIVAPIMKLLEAKFPHDP